MMYSEAKNKIYLQLKKLNPHSMEYGKKLLAYSSVLEKMFPDDFYTNLNQLNFLEEFHLWKKISLEMVKEVQQYRLDVMNKKIIVSLDNQSIAHDLVDVKDYLKTFTENEEDYLLLLSFIIRTENFELFQIAQLIKS